MQKVQRRLGPSIEEIREVVRSRNRRPNVIGKWKYYEYWMWAHKSNAYSPYRMMGRFDLSILPCDLEDIRQSGRDMHDQGWK
jgi:hypothetical protein